MSMPAVPVVHEYMHQGAGQEQQKRQGAHHVRQMLRQKEIGGHRADDDQTDAIAGTPEAGRCFVFSRVVVHGDAPLSGGVEKGLLGVAFEDLAAPVLQNQQDVVRVALPAIRGSIHTG